MKQYVYILLMIVLSNLELNSTFENIFSAPLAKQFLSSKLTTSLTAGLSGLAHYALYKNSQQALTYSLLALSSLNYVQNTFISKKNEVFLKKAISFPDKITELNTIYNCFISNFRFSIERIENYLDDNPEILNTQPSQELISKSLEFASPHSQLFYHLSMQCQCMVNIINLTTIPDNKHKPTVLNLKNTFIYHSEGIVTEYKVIMDDLLQLFEIETSRDQG